MGSGILDESLLWDQIQFIYKMRKNITWKHAPEEELYVGKAVIYKTPSLKSTGLFGITQISTA